MQSKKKSICFDTIMDKEALLKIILSDIGEVETLVKSFQGNEVIPSAFIELTEQKLAHILNEFALLRSIAANPDKAAADKKIVDKQEEVISSAPMKPSVVQSQEDVKSAETKLKVSQEKEVGEPVREEKIRVVEAPVEEQSKKQSPDAEPMLAERKVQEEEVNVSFEEINKAELENHAKTLGDSFVGEKKSVNDLMASSKESKLQKTLLGKPVNDLTKSLGINDRFMFQRELFEGNADVMLKTLQQLNELPDFSSAHSFILAHFRWDEEQEVTQAFYSYIKRKYEYSQL